MMLISIFIISAALSTASGSTFESSNYPGYFIRHRGYKLYIDRADNSQLFKEDSSFKVVAALNGDPNFVSFESVNYPHHYIRHRGYRLQISYYENSNLFKKDASWRKKNALNGRANYYSFESNNYPGHYFRHRGYEIWLDRESSSQLYKDDASFTFNPVLSGCTHWKNFQWLGTNPLFPAEATVLTIGYNNNGPINQQAGNVGAQKCKEASYEMTQETHWDVTVEVSTSVKIFGQGVDVSVSTSFGGSTSKTKGTVDSTCISFDFTTAQCPARYNCRRLITLSEVKDQTKEFTATLVCGGLELPYKGKMKINGGFDVGYEDKFSPINCNYYTDDYNDRNGKQPYCDHCSSVDVCDSCEPGYYLIQNGNRRECINYGGCLYECQGTPDNSVANELQCKNANAARPQCQAHLSDVILIPISQSALIIICRLLAALFICNFVLIVKRCWSKKKQKRYSIVKYMDSDSEVESDAKQLNV